MHTTPAGDWRCGESLGVGKTLLTSSTTGGLEPPPHGWCDGNGVLLDDVLCLETAVWTGLALRHAMWMQSLLNKPKLLATAKPQAAPRGSVRVAQRDPQDDGARKKCKTDVEDHREPIAVASGVGPLQRVASVVYEVDETGDDDAVDDTGDGDTVEELVDADASVAGDDPVAGDGSTAGSHMDCVNYGIKRTRYAFHMLPAKLELKGPAVYTLRYR